MLGLDFVSLGSNVGTESPWQPLRLVSTLLDMISCVNLWTLRKTRRELKIENARFVCEDALLADVTMLL